MGIGSHIHVKMVTEEVTFPVRIPSPVAIRLGIKAFAVTGAAAFFQTVTESLFALPCSSTDRGTVTGKGKLCRIDQSAFYGFVKKLLMI